MPIPCLQTNVCVALGIGLCPPVYMPMPSSLNIGHGLWDDCDIDDRDWWVEA